MLADHDIYALPIIRIPVSRLQKQILDNKNNEQPQVPAIVHIKHENNIFEIPSLTKETYNWNKKTQNLQKNNFAKVIYFKFSFIFLE